ncbi:MAG: HAMP domain-containing histidine kinase [Clostridia bacterium]|nr:HAMP domain-containing histidine kinase [Clostridia bacterium]
MIRKLKIKVILLSMISLLVLLTVMVAAMNLVNYNAVVNRADEVLTLLSQNRGAFPDFGGDMGHRLPPHLSPELPDQSRYFSVLLDNTGKVLQTDTGRITAVDAQAAAQYAQAVLQRKNDRGFVTRFRFVRTREGNGVRITFLDSGQELDSFYRFLLISTGMALAGFVVAFFVISFLAGRIIRPMAESYEKQKRFITDAGHEIKTPLTIINANVDVLEMDLGKNECLEDIQLQTKRLTTLTNDLVLLARMEEAADTLPMIEFPISEVVADAALPFRTPALAQGKDLICRIQPMLSMRGNGKAIEQLVSLLMDNALKYSSAGSAITLDLVQQAKTIYLTVANVTETAITRENLQLIFDRFYRTDPSRNSETGGHGIGLSVAKAIVTAHGGKIQATAPQEYAFCITAALPM